jgi:cyclomaltodextrinase / maltogenic alpha-amylase / neopullulanase
MFNTMIGRRPCAWAFTLFLALAGFGGMQMKACAARPSWLGSSVIYCVYTGVFSPAGNFNGVTAQLPRLKALGITAIWLMPVTPIGKPIAGHPAFGSPYCVHDYYAVNPAYGTAQDLHRLISKAHALGLKVVLDEVLNHTSWDNALIRQHPEFYVHGFGDPHNPASITQAFNFADVAQLNYANHSLWAYMDQMLGYWVTTYHVDGFRFDTADDPGGPHRMIPAAFWSQAGAALRGLDRDILLLGESDTPDLAEKPFQLEYDWSLFHALIDAVNGGNAQNLVEAWKKQTADNPPGMLYMNIQQDWDTSFDQIEFGGPAAVNAAATFNFTINGVPLIYNGMEVGNPTASTNPHATINWNPNSAWTAYYRGLIALRELNPALQQGRLDWLANSTPSQVVSYTRTDDRSQFLIVINTSNLEAIGQVTIKREDGWRCVWPLLRASTRPAGDAGTYQLEPHDYSVFQRELTQSASK